MSFQMYVPTRILFGAGQLNHLHEQKMPGKKAMLVISNLVFAAFDIYLLYIVMTIIGRLGNSQTTLLRLPQQMVYSIIPIGLVLSVVRIAQDTIKLMHENEANLGASKPAMDLDECERIYLEKKAAREAAAVKGEVR